MLLTENVVSFAGANIDLFIKLPTFLMNYLLVFYKM